MNPEDSDFMANAALHFIGGNPLLVVGEIVWPPLHSNHTPIVPIIRDIHGEDYE